MPGVGWLRRMPKGENITPSGLFNLLWTENLNCSFAGPIFGCHYASVTQVRNRTHESFVTAVFKIEH